MTTAELTGTVAELLERWRCPLELVATGPALLRGAVAEDPATGPTPALDEFMLTESGPSNGLGGIGIESLKNELELTPAPSKALDKPKSGTVALESPKPAPSEESPA
jgi:hypothetical protein